MRPVVLVSVISGLLLALSSCSDSSMSVAPQGTPHYEKLSLSAVEKQSFTSKEDLDTLFMQTRYAQPEEKNPLYITISRRLTKDAQYPLANILLDKTTGLTVDEHEEKHLLLAQQNMNLRRYDKAYQALINLRDTPAVDHPRYQLLLSWYYYERGSFSSYLLTLNDAIQTAKTKQTKLSQDLLLVAWASVQLANRAQLDQLEAHPEPILKGWVALRSLVDPMDNPSLTRSPEETIVKLTQWRQDNPEHPGNRLFKRVDYDSKTPLAAPKKINKIGLMLPLTGKNQKASQLIQKSLFSTYFQLRPHDQMLSVYDCGQKQATTLYTDAIKDDHVQAIIGPLTKSETDQLINEQPITVPTLVLNGSRFHKPLLTQYSLSPAQETQQLVMNMRLSGYNHPLVISDQSPVAQQISQDFIAQFVGQGGVVADFALLSGDFNQAVSKALGTESSQQRYRYIQSLSPDPVRMVLHKRQDIDSIFFTGDLKNARQLVPMLKYHYSGNLPIFSTSSVNKSINHFKNKDLSTALFFDTPLSNTNASGPEGARQVKSLLQKLQSADPKHFSEYYRFYGLGIDAYLITQTSYLWDVLDGYTIIGINGMLFKDSEGNIQRGLSRMVFKDGAAIADQRYDTVREQWRVLTHEHI